jgi:peptide/nickel transport system substrate-binding protein
MALGARHPNGFETSDLTPLPADTALGEAVAGYLQAVGIKSLVRTLERAAFLASWREKKLKGLLIGATGAAGNAAARLEPFVTKNGIYAYGTLPELEDLFDRQARELNRKRRESLLHQIQRAVADHMLVAPLFQQAFIMGRGLARCRGGRRVDRGLPVRGAVRGSQASLRACEEIGARKPGGGVWGRSGERSPHFN